MTKLTLLFALLFGAAFDGNTQADTTQTPREFEIQEGDTTYVMKQYIMTSWFF